MDKTLGTAILIKTVGICNEKNSESSDKMLEEYYISSSHNIYESNLLNLNIENENEDECCESDINIEFRRGYDALSHKSNESNIESEYFTYSDIKLKVTDSNFSQSDAENENEDVKCDSETFSINEPELGFNQSDKNEDNNDLKRYTEDESLLLESVFWEKYYRNEIRLREEWKNAFCDVFKKAYPLCVLSIKWHKCNYVGANRTFFIAAAQC